MPLLGATTFPSTSFSVTWDLVVTKPAEKNLRRLPANDLRRIETALAAMREDPFSGDIARLKAQPAAWRRRVGNYRILYDLHPEQLLIVVTGILRRTSTTH